MAIKSNSAMNSLLSSLPRPFITFLGLEDRSLPVSGTSRSLVQSVTDLVSNITKSSFKKDNEAERLEALRAAHELVAKLETPSETCLRLALTEPAILACLQTARDLSLFEKWHEVDDGARHSKGLAEMVGCEEFTLQRILRHLASHNLLVETAPNTFQQTEFTISMIEPKFGEWIFYAFNVTIESFHKFPEYLRQHDYKGPTDSKNGMFQLAKGLKDESIWEFFGRNSRYSYMFNSIMDSVLDNSAHFLEFYPKQRLLEDSEGRDSPILVDVGGSVGYDIDKVRSALEDEDLEGRLILQDKSSVIEEAFVKSPINKMAHDFFTDQPVKGSRVYFLHSILHDWSDERARKILLNLTQAMTPNYSRILIHDHVMPDQGVPRMATTFDMSMMSQNASYERNESMWKELLESVGLTWIKTWRSSRSPQSVIEAELS